MTHFYKISDQDSKFSPFDKTVNVKAVLLYCYESFWVIDL